MLCVCVNTLVFNRLIYIVVYQKEDTETIIESKYLLNSHYILGTWLGTNDVKNYRDTHSFDC